ncbi:hypothetical protein SAZ11_57500 [Streptomyces sp. FXJ1.4098]|nr:hypothetical protein [Streptomyces sp. FXJ1.4098]
MLNDVFGMTPDTVADIVGRTGRSVLSSPIARVAVCGHGGRIPRRRSSMTRPPVPSGRPV